MRRLGLGLLAAGVVLTLLPVVAVLVFLFLAVLFA